MGFAEEIVYLVSTYGVSLFNAMLLTLEITSIGFTLGVLLGLPISLGRVYGPLPLKALLAAYIELLRRLR